MSQLADLHIHSYYSDGTSSPEEIIIEAHQLGLKCVSITDHDTIEAVSFAQQAAVPLGVEVIPGVELSSQINGRDVHILGYLIDCHDPELLNLLSSMQQFRIERIKKMIERLHELGLKNIELAEVASKTKSNSLGRPHLAMVMMDKGMVSSIKAAFDKYLAEEAVAYVSKFQFDPFEVIKIIKKARGVAVLAHPMITLVDELIPRLVQAGLDGLEVYYPYVAKNITEFYLGIARKHDLLITGGSDAHGKAKKHTFLGRVTVPYELVTKLKERAMSV